METGPWILVCVFRLKNKTKKGEVLPIVKTENRPE